LRLDIAFAPAPPLGTPKESWSVPEHRQVKTTVVLGNQQLVVLGSPLLGSAKPSVVVLTPYVVRDDADLRRLFVHADCPPRGAINTRGYKSAPWAYASALFLAPVLRRALYFPAGRSTVKRSRPSRARAETATATTPE
jgi:hypothetical protein